jgi:hypothetical protein
MRLIGLRQLSDFDRQQRLGIDEGDDGPDERVYEE